MIPEPEENTDTSEVLPIQVLKQRDKPLGGLLQLNLPEGQTLWMLQSVDLRGERN